MSSSVRNRLVCIGLLWGAALAVFPAFFAFDDPFTLSPFLVCALLCSALAGIFAALSAGRWTLGRVARDGRTGFFVPALSGTIHGVLFGLLVSFSVWVCLAVNISGFSTATPGNISNLVTEPGIFLVSGVAAGAVLAYALAAGLLLSPLTGAVILRAARIGGGRFAETA